MPTSGKPHTFKEIHSTTPRRQVLYGKGLCRAAATLTRALLLGD
jgi:hypothetical protein